MQTHTRTPDETILVIATCADHALTLIVPKDTDFDECFTATCADTGDRLRVNGWLYGIQAHNDEEMY